MCRGAHSPPRRQADGHGWTGAASAPFARHRQPVLRRRSLQLPRPTCDQSISCVRVGARVLQVGRSCAVRVELAVIAHVQACMQPFLLSAPRSLLRRSPHEHAWFSKLGAPLLRASRTTRAPKASQERTAYRRTASGAMLALTRTLPLPLPVCVTCSLTCRSGTYAPGVTRHPAMVVGVALRFHLDVDRVRQWRATGSRDPHPFRHRHQL